MKGSGCGRLTYGACYDYSNVKVYLDGAEISNVYGAGTATVQFDFTDGQELKIVEGMTIMIFHSFEECFGGLHNYISTYSVPIEKL